MSAEISNAEARRLYSIPPEGSGFPSSSSAAGGKLRMNSESSAPSILARVGYFGYGALILAGAALFAVLFLVTREGNVHTAGFVAPGSNCSVITCPAGPVGPQGVPGVSGPPGAQGPAGPSGPPGPQGVQGLPGPTGPIGQCSNTNPFCTQGATGPTGAQGIPGPTGLAGLPGPTGPQGLIGPQGFIGPIGPTGPTGPQGIQGVVGPNGSCDCFQLPLANITALNVSGTFTLSGSMTCPGGALDSSCFGLVGMCPDFSTCFLAALGLDITSTSNVTVPRLNVGMGLGDAGKSVVHFGAYPNNVVQAFTAYVQGLFSLASVNNPIDITSYFGNMNLQAIGGPTVTTTVSSSGQLNLGGTYGASMIATNGNVFMEGGASQIQLLSGTDVIKTQSTNLTVSATDFQFFKSLGTPYLQSQSATSVQCAGSGPFVSIASTSLLASFDVILESGVKLLTNNPSGLINMAGIELCGFLIKTTSSTLQLQDGTATKTLDIHATITNSEGSFGVQIISPNGVNFIDTSIRNEGGVAGPLVCNDVEGFALLNTSTLYASNMAPVSPSTSMTFTGDLIVTGSITANSVISTMGSCCTSDIRAKRNITEVDTRTDLETILSIPRRVAFKYTPGYAKVDKSVNALDVHHGFIAQELESVLPRSVVLVNQTIDGISYSDFRRVTLDRIVPHVVGAVKELYKEHTKLVEEVRELRKIVMMFTATHAA